MKLIDKDKLFKCLMAKYNGVVCNRSFLINPLIKQTKLELLNEVIEMVEEQPTVNTWISCKERLPEDSRSVLICTNDGGLAEGSYNANEKMWYQFRWGVKNAKVIAWCELPKLCEG